MRRAITPTDENLSVEPEWRREVSDRLHSYRVRRHGAVAARVQSALPFFDRLDVPTRGAAVSVEVEAATDEVHSEFVAEEADSLPAYIPPTPAEQSPIRRQPRTERVEISIPKHETAYHAAKVHRPAAAHPGFGTARDALFPVAPLHERRRAATVDVALLLFTYGGMLALFWALGGRIGWNKLDVVVTGATLVLFYAQYFALFTVFGGCTPGMMLCRLRVLSFDGGMPTSRQMIWRSFGYLVSAGTCFLGFLWALWDEDSLCWQDRISRTYLTLIEDFAPGKSQASAARDLA